MLPLVTRTGPVPLNMRTARCASVAVIATWWLATPPVLTAQSSQCLMVTYAPDSLRQVLPTRYLLTATRARDGVLPDIPLPHLVRWWPSQGSPYVVAQWRLFRGMPWPLRARTTLPTPTTPTTRMTHSMAARMKLSHRRSGRAIQGLRA